MQHSGRWFSGRLPVISSTGWFKSSSLRPQAQQGCADSAGLLLPHTPCHDVALAFVRPAAAGTEGGKGYLLSARFVRVQTHWLGGLLRSRQETELWVVVARLRVDALLVTRNRHRSHAHWPMEDAKLIFLGLLSRTVTLYQFTLYTIMSKVEMTVRGIQPSKVSSRICVSQASVRCAC